jgi:hypothetical protein
MALILGRAALLTAAITQVMPRSIAARGLMPA